MLKDFIYSSKFIEYLLYESHCYGNLVHISE